MGETVDGVPFGVSLHRWSLDNIGIANCPLADRFAIKYVIEGDVEPARLARPRKACADKLPKLAAWKRSDNARTILVLEENDISLTNHQRVADALVLAEAGLGDLPDEVFLVSSHIADLWVTCLRRPGKTYYDDGERFYEVAPATLTRLTRR